MMRAFHIIGIVLSVVLFVVCIYYVNETSYARWGEWDAEYFNDTGYGYDYYTGPSSASLTQMAAGISTLLTGFFLASYILSLIKIKTMTSKVLSIIGLCLGGITFLFGLAVMAEPSGMTYDESGAMWAIFSVIALAFSIVLLVQAVIASKKETETFDDTVIDDELGEA